MKVVRRKGAAAPSSNVTNQSPVRKMEGPSGPGSEKYRSVAEEHAPNRINEFIHSGKPLSEFWTAFPVRCHWCREEQPLSKLKIASGLSFKCTDDKTCEKARTKRLTAKYGKTPDEPKRRVIKRSSTPAKSLPASKQTIDAVAKELPKRRIVRRKQA